MKRLTDKQIEQRATHMVGVMERIGTPISLDEAKKRIIASMEEALAGTRLSEDELEYCATARQNGYRNEDQMERD